MQNFRNLDVWQFGHNLTLGLYRTTTAFPKTEQFGLISQIRRASASIGANIAEGCGRRSNADLGRFLQISMGSASEWEYHLLLARDLEMLRRDDYERLNRDVTRVKKMLSRLINGLVTQGKPDS